MSLSEFRPAACRSSSFQLLHVAISELCRLSEFTCTLAGPLWLLNFYSKIYFLFSGMLQSTLMENTVM